MKKKNQKKGKIRKQKIKSKSTKTKTQQSLAPNLSILFFTTINLLCADLFLWFAKIKDRRNKIKKVYPVQTLLITGLFMFNLHLKARRKISKRLNKKRIIDKIAHASGVTLDKLPHGDTINDFLETLAPEALQSILDSMNYNLLRSKKMDKYRLLDKYFTIAIDLTKTHSFKKKHNEDCKHCMQEKDKEKNITGYHHSIVEADLVTWTALRIPLMSEFLTNQKNSTKQDCELVAAKRLLHRLKKKYSKFKICILGDSLYSCRDMFRLITKKFKWKFVLNFKEKKIPRLHEKFEDFKKINDYIHHEKKVTAKTKRFFNFKNDVQHEDYSVNMIEFTEKDYKEIEYYNIFLTNINITKDNVDELCIAGRTRWQIELAFRDKKKKGFYLEHAYSHNPNAILCFHILMLIAYWINQFMLQLHNDNGINNLKKIFGSLEDVFVSLLESFSEYDFIPADAQKVKQARFLRAS